jgi:hypothetical protein
MFWNSCLKSKAIPVTGWRPIGLWDVEGPTLSRWLTDGGKVASLMCRPPFTPPGRFLVLISVRGWVDPRAIVRLEGLGQLKKIHLIGTWTRDLPACSIVPQPTTLPCAPEIHAWIFLFFLHNFFPCRYFAWMLVPMGNSQVVFQH